MKINAEEVKKCSICQNWITYCLSEPTYEDRHTYSTWVRAKQSFWDANKGYLESMGFNYEAGLCKALDFIELNKHQRQDLEGCLLIVKVGSKDKPATPQEVEMTYKLMKDALDDVKGVRVIIAQHTFSIEKVALPQLRRLQSEILTSFEPEENSNPIISNLEI